MFGRIARRYDLLNHLLSLGLDFYWWRQMAKTAGAKPGIMILDVASGTGDSALALTKKGASVVISDFAMPMLALGLEKYRKKKPFAKLQFCKFNGVDRLRRNKAGRSKGADGEMEGAGVNEVPQLPQGKKPDLLMGAALADAMNLPFKNSTFDAVAICYGIRNVEHRHRAYAEFRRVLKPGGRLVILEFSRPRWAWLRCLYGIYSRYLLPAIGGLVSGDRAAYKYLHESIQRFPSQKELAQEIEKAGFIDVEWQNLSFGIVALHTGTVSVSVNSPAL
jgi:demethylmenaquinone methyltransferase/2-methoxy-6-polyprenyl-1,4-benzoquinol methylase